LRLLLDQNIPGPVAVRIVKAFPGSIYVQSDPKLKGSDDDHLFRYAIRNKMVLVTQDSDFSNILTFPPAATEGIIFLRSEGSLSGRVRSHLMSFLLQADPKKIRGRLVIISKNSIRFRPAHG
jgi:predicted nuclease of predicted toxin-antitoxin system